MFIESCQLKPLNITKSGLKGLAAGIMWFKMAHIERCINDQSSCTIFYSPQQNIYSTKGINKQFMSFKHLFSCQNTSKAQTLLASTTLSLYIYIYITMANVNSSFLLFLGSYGYALLLVLAGESLDLLYGSINMNF